MNKITVLTNNVILIGDTDENAYGVIIQKPHSITLSPDGYVIQPFLEKFTGQNWPELFIKDKDVLCVNKAENNEILQGYLEKISGIQTEDKKIII